MLKKIYIIAGKSTHLIYIPVSLDTLQLSLFLFAALLIGMSKSGVSGLGNIAIPIMASIFGGKASTGILLPILIFADTFAVIYYRRTAEWKYVLRLLPWTIVGVALGTWVGNQISDQFFKQLIAILILSGIALMIYRDWKKLTNVPEYWWFAAIMGLLGGFTTMVGNAAGPIMAIYLLSMNLPRDHFIGTKAWFFFIVNISKLPFHIFFWHTITWQSLSWNLMTIPAIGLGAYFGLKLVKQISNRQYRVFMMVITSLSAFLLLTS